MLAIISAYSAGEPNAAAQETTAADVQYRAVVIDRRDPRLDAIIAQDAKAEIIAEGLKWSEGPVWIGGAEDGYLLFSDVPGNRMYKWSRDGGAGVFLDPSGAPHDAEGFREPGSNGLIRDISDDSILVANHGLRAVARLDLKTRQYEILADEYGGEPFNSPNDLVLASDGAIYFTDPPYGLDGISDSPMKRQPANGVYRRDPSGAVALLIDDLTFPNGIGLSPDEKTLYVAVSDPNNPVILRYDLTADDIPASRTVIHDGASKKAQGEPGLPDGLSVDARGNLFATAPGGVHIFSPGGDLLGVVDTGVSNANCAIGEGGKTLFIAANHQVLRLPLASAHAE
ncbi:gluconolactonase [Marinicaulis flavus]|uniref:Gluconolactonase n=2 Tax=Hyphococcus luteus TaxID=2058213 RepID=A0A2S7KBC6_9PROT|nr:gluconolactonase [Marinicaulis flavus]